MHGQVEVASLQGVRADGQGTARIGAAGRLPPHLERYEGYLR